MAFAIGIITITAHPAASDLSDRGSVAAKAQNKNSGEFRRDSAEYLVIPQNPTHTQQHNNKPNRDEQSPPKTKNNTATNLLCVRNMILLDDQFTCDANERQNCFQPISS